MKKKTFGKRSYKKRAKKRCKQPRLPPGTALALRDAVGRQRCKPDWWLGGKQLMPATMMCRHKYKTVSMIYSDQAGTADYGVTLFRMNSMYQIYNGTINVSFGLPNALLQPSWRDHMVTQYTRYCVVKSRLKARFTAKYESGSTNAGAWCSVYRDPKYAGAAVIIPTSPEDLDQLTVSAQGARIKRLAPNTPAIGGGGGGDKTSVVIDGPVYSYADLALSARETNNQTSYNANPSYVPSWYVQVNSTGDVNDFNIYVEVYIEFDVLWSNRVTTIGEDDL